MTPPSRNQRPAIGPSAPSRSQRPAIGPSDRPTAAASDALPSIEGDIDARWTNYSFTGLIAPVFAGFSLPAIIVFASNTYPGPPSHGIILSLLVIAAGLFMASIQLTSPLVNDWTNYAGLLRGALTMLGVCVVAVAIILLGAPAMHQWYGIAALIVIFIGSVAPAVLLSILLVRAYRSASAAGRQAIGQTR